MNRSDISQMIEDVRKHAIVGERAVIPGMLMRIAGFGQVMCGLWNGCRRVWWMVRMRDAYTSDNFFNLVAGHGMGLLMDQSKILRMASMAVLVAARVLASVDQYSKLRDSWDRFLLAWRDQLTPSLEISWEKNKRTYWSTSTRTRIVHAVKEKLYRVQRIAGAFLKVIKETFVLSMRMTDALEAFHCSPETRNESLNLFFVNGAFLIDQFTKNQERLMDELKRNQEVINGMFKKLNSKLTVDSLIQHLPKQEMQELDVTPKEKTLFDLGKAWWSKIKFEGASLFGLEKYVNQPVDFFGEDPIKEEITYVSDKMITRPSVFINQKNF